MSWRLFHHNKRVENRVMTSWFRLAVVCLLLPLAWGLSLSTKASETAPAPTAIRADSLDPAEVSEAVILADRILARETDDLLIDAERRRELAREIEGVLERLRYAHPEMAKISARAAHLPGVLILGVKPGLFGAVSRTLGEEKGPVKLRTGNRAFDALNVRLGLRAVRPYRHTGVLVMRFSDRLNVRAAQKAYMKMAEVEYAEADVYLGDSSGIEAVKSGEAWHIVVRKAWGDCPSGCLFKKTFFFTVKGDEVERIESVRAMDIPDVRKILETRKWR